MEIYKLVDRIEDILEEASAVPFSNKVMVDLDELYELTRELRIQLPDEMKQATWIKEERQRILTEAEEEAKELIGQAEERLEEMVNEHKVTKIAEKRAKEIEKKAILSAKQIRSGALEYADNILLKTQEDLKSYLDIINKNRQELREGDK